MEIVKDISTTKTGSNTTAPMQFLEANHERYAYRRFGNGPRLPLLFLQHFTGTLDNRDPAVTDPLADGREVILFDTPEWDDPAVTCHKQLLIWRSTFLPFSTA